MHFVEGFGVKFVAFGSAGVEGGLVDAAEELGELDGSEDLHPAGPVFEGAEFGDELGLLGGTVGGGRLVGDTLWGLGRSFWGMKRGWKQLREDTIGFGGVAGGEEGAWSGGRPY